MYMDEKMDTGDIILKREVDIGADETTGELWDRLAQVGGELLVETIDRIEKGTAPRIKQTDDFSMAPILTKDMAKINWEEKTTQEIKNLVRGLNPIMGAYSFLNGKKIKLWKVDKVDFKENAINVTPGTVVYSDNKKGLYIKTIDGFLSILELQAENSKKLNILEFLRGNKIEENEKFE